MNKDMYQVCIDACIECIDACNVCFDACLEEDHMKMMAYCIRLDRECADICALAVKSMQSNSPFAKEICNLCAVICKACGEECQKHDHDHCQKCAGACFKCADACLSMTA
ncbi:four-helix bundle copper-binding protein [Bacillus sp. E214]|uniref:four-helix bundle copper-binding protein n=1 Tax=Bacillus sp. E214 TaxID=2587156 RepID=UPI0011DFF784|nr:four-helix bundle copper-binding protein [Bacillus sp. E214]